MDVAHPHAARAPRAIASGGTTLFVSLAEGVLMSTTDAPTRSAAARASGSAIPTAAMPAEAKVMAALRAQPASSVAEIALAAGVGRSTAGKILTAAENDQRVHRTAGGIDRGRRTPDRWTLIQRDKPSRLGRGALRDMVAEFLSSHPGAEFGPTAIGKALGRSSGAVSNALTKLAADGHVVQVSERPLRFTAKPSDQTPQ